MKAGKFEIIRSHVPYVWDGTEIFSMYPIYGCICARANLEFQNSGPSGWGNTYMVFQPERPTRYAVLMQSLMNVYEVRRIRVATQMLSHFINILLR